MYIHIYVYMYICTDLNDDIHEECDILPIINRSYIRHIPKTVIPCSLHSNATRDNRTVKTIQ